MNGRDLALGVVFFLFFLLFLPLTLAKAQLPLQITLPHNSQRPLRQLLPIHLRQTPQEKLPKEVEDYICKDGKRPCHDIGMECPFTATCTMPRPCLEELWVGARAGGDTGWQDFAVEDTVFEGPGVCCGCGWYVGCCWFILGATGGSAQGQGQRWVRPRRVIVSIDRARGSCRIPPTSRIITNRVSKRLHQPRRRHIAIPIATRLLKGQIQCGDI